MFSVETVVKEQLPQVFSNNPVLRKPTLGFLRYLFHEAEFHRFEQNYPHLKGFDFIDQVLDFFDFHYTVSQRDIEAIPTQGRVVIVANHPIGSLDGLALLKLVGSLRRDVKAVANDILSEVKPLQHLFLPVDAMTNKTVKENIRAIEHHLKAEGAIVIFPAGEVSRFGPKGVRDGRWRSGFLKFARKTQAPIVPVYVDGRNSAFFYSLSLLAKPLSTLWLIREMFKQANSVLSIKIGKPVPFETYNGLPLDTKATAALFRRHVYKLAKNKSMGCFAAKVEAVAHPEERKALREEIRRCELLGETHDGKQIKLYQFDGDSSVMRELARLRELSFRAVAEGTGKRRDMDAFDSYYDHIVLWDDEELEIVGAYRLVRTQQFVEAGQDRLYTQTLFDYNENARGYLRYGVELGRSFVQPRYWGRRGLEYLWFGIGAYVRKFPEVRYLFGPVSISNSYSSAAKNQLVDFYQHYFSPETVWVTAKTPYLSGEQCQEFTADYQDAFVTLKANLSELGFSVPTLYKQYSELCEPGGVEFQGFNVDSDFSDCVDGFVVVDIEKMKPSKKNRYILGL